MELVAQSLSHPDQAPRVRPIYLGRRFDLDTDHAPMALEGGIDNQDPKAAGYRENVSWGDRNHPRASRNRPSGSTPTVTASATSAPTAGPSL